jgi:hypothetical protein
MQKKRWIGELEELKAIFDDCLPIGEKTEEVEAYFNRLKEVIFTNDFNSNPDPLRREEFDGDNPDVQYSYLSDAVFKERSSIRELRAVRQGLDDRPFNVDEGEVSQCGGEIAPDPPSIPQCEGDCCPIDWDQDSDNPGW